MKMFNKIPAFTLTIMFAFSFTGQVMAATSPTLTASSTYSILSGAAVTNTGATTMPGNLGISPGIGPAPHYTGFPPGIVNLPGTIHDADVDAGLAQADNTAAFGFIDQACTVTYAGTKDLVGLNLVPGVYCADAFALSGTLTLSGTSGVWIFKSASDIITSGTANVVGGDPCNVWWRAVSSVTLGTNTSMIGNILASTAITMVTGADLSGRAMTQTAAVTLDANTITNPICSASAPVTPTPTPTPITELPETGASGENSIPWYIVIPIGIFATSVLFTVIQIKKKIV